MRLLKGDDGDVLANARAARLALKERVRSEVVRSELTGASAVSHLPESLNIELTPRCNLECGHCSSHGTPDLHRRHNQMKDLPVDVLRRLADEVFPSLTVVSLLGRGEPLLSRNELWDELLTQLRRHEVLLNFVTNGTLLRHRLTEELMPLLDTITVSVDGGTGDTMAANRRGATLDGVMEGIARFDELRRRVKLPRRPRLAVSWTLKRNNIEELPGFIEALARFEPDLFVARHLLVFFEKDQAESLIGSEDFANGYLRRAYAALAAHGIRSDCPPLMTSAVAPVVSESASPRGRCVFIHRTAVVHSTGEIPTCSLPFAPRAGSLLEASSFRDVWSGAVLNDARRAMGTADEWKQCRECWYREAHYSTQRDLFEQGKRFDLTAMARFSQRAWDFRDFEK